MVCKTGESPYNFVANPDGSLTFSLTVTATLTPSTLKEVTEGVIKTCCNRIRYEPNSFHLDDLIAATPTYVIDEFLKAARMAQSFEKPGQAKE